MPFVSSVAGNSSMLHKSGLGTAMSKSLVLHQPPSPAPRAVQVFDLADDTVALRSLDHKRDRFDIEFALQAGSSMKAKTGSAACAAQGAHAHKWGRQLWVPVLPAMHYLRAT